MSGRSSWAFSRRAPKTFPFNEVSFIYTGTRTRNDSHRQRHGVFCLHTNSTTILLNQCRTRYRLKRTSEPTQ